MAKLVGYARVSTNEQELNLQIDALLAAGCQKKDIFVDKLSGAKSERPGLTNCLACLEKGDTLIVWRLDRLSRSMHELIKLIETLKAQGVGFKSICDGAIDTTTASGEFMLNIFASLAQFERRLIQERTTAGLAAARARGKKGGRRKLDSSEPKIITAQKMHQDHNMSVADICRTLKISRSSFYRYVATKQSKHL